VRDVVQGNGEEAATGDQVSVQYVGTSWSTGKEFDSSWSRNKEPFKFQVGSGMVIPGWDQGIIGMKVGGRRELVVPPDMAYGPQGQPPAIGPNETLIFVIDLEKVE
jgi:peptidylprolyl isomerase